MYSIKFKISYKFFFIVTLMLVSKINVFCCDPGVNPTISYDHCADNFGDAFGACQDAHDTSMAWFYGLTGTAAVVTGLGSGIAIAGSGGTLTPLVVTGGTVLVEALGFTYWYNEIQNDFFNCSDTAADNFGSCYWGDDCWKSWNFS